jgi:hypothetical protein
VELVRAYGQLLRLVMQRGELLAQLDKATARLLLQARWADGGCLELACCTQSSWRVAAVEPPCN